MVTSTSKHDITKEKIINIARWNLTTKKNLENDIINDDVINYWHKDLQLLVNDEMS